MDNSFFAYILTALFFGLVVGSFFKKQKAALIFVYALVGTLAAAILATLCKGPIKPNSSKSPDPVRKIHPAGGLLFFAQNRRLTTKTKPAILDIRTHGIIGRANINPIRYRGYYWDAEN